MTRAYHKGASAPTSPICSDHVPSQDGTVTAKLPGFASAGELAAANLPGLPASHSAMVRRAKSAGWTYIDRVGQGGGRLYRIADLPFDAQAALRQHRVEAVTIAPVGRPRGTDFFTRNPNVAAAVELIISQRIISASEVMELLEQEFMSLPSVRSLRRFIARLEEERVTVFASIRDPDTFKGKYRVALGRADGNTDRAHQIWEVDATKADVMTTDGRKMILGVIDRWSRRALFMVAESESAQSVRRLIVTAIQRWSVTPETIMTDRGSGFISASVVSACDILDIDHWDLPPASGDKKPHIERVFGTFTRARAELFDGYIGHSVADAQRLRAKARKDTGRPVIEARMSAADLQTALDGWVDGVYHQREHSSLRMSPMRKWLSTPALPRAPASAEVLRMALSALVGTRTVGKRGVLWQQGRYWSATLSAWVGRQVVVRRVEDELGELLIFSPEGLFIDVAVNHERRGLSQAEFAIEAKAHQSKWVSDQRASIKKSAGDFTFEDARNKLLLRDLEDAGKLVSLPLPTQPHTNAAIEALAGGAGSAAPQPVARERSTPATILPMRKSPAQKMREADAIIARADTGEAVDADELRRARLYVTTSEYRAQRAVAEHFALPTTQTSA